LDKRQTMAGLGEHFIHKGRKMEPHVGEKPRRITRQIDRLHKQALSNVANSVKGFQPRRVLDVGTGYGRGLKFLAHRFGNQSQIWSVDASPKVVREVRRMMKEHKYSRHVTVKNANAERLPFKSDHFDLILSLFSLHHLSNPKRGLSEMTRVLSRGGKLVIADWTPLAGERLILHAHVDMPSPRVIEKELTRLGCRTRKCFRRYWYLIETSK